MKTALQHFNELPEPYGQMAIDETIKEKLSFWVKRRIEQIKYLDSLYSRRHEYSSWRYEEVLQSATSVLNNIWVEIQHLESKTTDK